MANIKTPLKTFALIDTTNEAASRLLMKMGFSNPYNAESVFIELETCNGDVKFDSTMVRLVTVKGIIMLQKEAFLGAVAIDSDEQK